MNAVFITPVPFKTEIFNRGREIMSELGINMKGFSVNVENRVR